MAELDSEICPSLVNKISNVLFITETIAGKIFYVLYFTGASYMIIDMIKHTDFSECLYDLGMCAKELIIPSDTPDPYDILSHLDSEEFWDSLLTWHRNDKAKLKASPPPLPDLKLQGLKDIVETLPCALDSSAANSTMPMDKPEQQQKTPLLRGALISRRGMIIS
ncbi:hypothetical protein MtrunA17_Chr5g0414121 [Medicago truncatula]|uniref:Uncharacterized protein n=1 Tax=Medicago truncatula TaxID=3880 RepID=A0A396HP48_MEDTR|nr:uncharacterized protein LOC11405977 isoform X2 [Medicago truncatula]RHN55109.1 hypothetical protein MtrunA17_Chr5g0414121 [Medicago truncatula]